MANSEMRKNIIALGERIVKELNLDPGVDTLSRWMSHYIAEKILIVKQSSGVKKKKAEEQCLESILKLWTHRKVALDGHPFENFEPIFRTLEMLDPDNINQHFYFNHLVNSSEKKKSGKNSDEIQKWLDLAMGIDQTARILLEYVFNNATGLASDSNANMWLKHFDGAGLDDDEILAILKLNEKQSSKNKTKEEKEVYQKQLKSKIDRLEAFSSLSQKLRDEFEGELRRM